MRQCNQCRHNINNKCSLKACAYIHINERDMYKHGVSLGHGRWLYKDIAYIVIGYELRTGSYICVEAEDGKT